MLLDAALALDRIGLRPKCLRYSPETRTRVHERVRGDPGARHRAAGSPQSTREVGLRPGRNHRDRRQHMDIGATVGRSGLRPDVERASEQSAACNHRMPSQRWPCTSSSHWWSWRPSVSSSGSQRSPCVGALRTRYSRRMNIAASSLLLFGLALALVALAQQKGSCRRSCSTRSSRRHAGSCLAAIVFTIVYVFWSGFAERVLTIRYASGAVAISAAFGAAWLTVLHMAGVRLAGMSAMNAVWILSPALLPLDGRASWRPGRSAAFATREDTGACGRQRQRQRFLSARPITTRPE